MIIRKMELRDLSQVVMIEESLFSDPWTENAFRDTLDQKEADFVVAVSEQEEIIGYCGAYRALDEAEIVNVAIRKKDQNQGGVHFFILEVRESNLSAQHCYEKLGFKSIGIRKNFYDCPRENALIMQMESIAGDE